MDSITVMYFTSKATFKQLLIITLATWKQVMWTTHMVRGAVKKNWLRKGNLT